MATPSLMLRTDLTIVLTDYGKTYSVGDSGS